MAYGVDDGTCFFAPLNVSIVMQECKKSFLMRRLVFRMVGNEFRKKK